MNFSILATRDDYTALTIAAIREGLASAARGELKDVDQVFKEIKEKYGLR